ncbi:MAG: GNAT family N-acetyltransferase [Treponema sp.]|jgi:predicted GNAT family N-acyltransferase|nr:GNAT family N-acetyltransferase [Treponema sp.]
MFIKNLEKEDFNEVLSVAESAFFEEELYKWTVPNASERGAFIKNFFQFRLESGFGKRLMEAAINDSKKIMGVAVWVPPVLENDREDILQSKSLFMNFISKFSDDIQERCFQFINTVEEAEKNFDKPYWILAPVFVKKEMQGKEVASFLIRSRLKLIDMKRLPCILVTQEENNIPIYTKYGFEVAVEAPVNTKIKSYGMIRK